MRMTARLLLIIPLGLLIAFFAGGFFLLLATVVSPAMAQMVFAGLHAFAQTVFGLAFEGEDPGPLAAAATWQGFKLVIAVLGAPVLITAMASELFKVRSGLIQMSLCGLLAAALPAALLGLRRLPSGSETQVLAAFFLTGIVTGAVYWLIAGRGAGPDGTAAQQQRGISGPPA